MARPRFACELQAVLVWCLCICRLSAGGAFEIRRIIDVRRLPPYPTGWAATGDFLSHGSVRDGHFLRSHHHSFATAVLDAQPPPYPNLLLVLRLSDGLSVCPFLPSRPLSLCLSLDIMRGRPRLFLRLVRRFSCRYPRTPMSSRRPFIGVREKAPLRRSRCQRW